MCYKKTRKKIQNLEFVELENRDGYGMFLKFGKEPLDGGCVMVNAIQEVADFVGDVVRPVADVVGDVVRPVADAAADVLRPVGEAILDNPDLKTSC